MRRWKRARRCLTGHGREAICERVGESLREHDHAQQGRRGKGLLRSYGAVGTQKRPSLNTPYFVYPNDSGGPVRHWPIYVDSRP